MPVKLRLRRLGRTHSAYYHVVAADSRAPRDGKFLEKIGTYNPVTNPAQIYIDHEAALKWLRNGAQPTETVRSLLSNEGVLLKFHLHRKGRAAEEITAEFEKWTAERARKAEAGQSTAERAKADEARKRQEAEREKRAKIAERVAAKRVVPEEPAAEAPAAAEAAAAAEADTETATVAETSTEAAAE